jgi:hypothetical protein
MRPASPGPRSAGPAQPDPRILAHVSPVAAVGGLANALTLAIRSERLIRTLTNDFGAEGRGFEPRRRLPAYTLSRRAPSSARASLRARFYGQPLSDPGVTVALTMAAVAWSAIGLLAATLVGSLFYLGSRIDALGIRLDSRIDNLESSLASRIDHLASRIDSMSLRLDAHIDQHSG